MLSELASARVTQIDSCIYTVTTHIFIVGGDIIIIQMCSLDSPVVTYYLITQDQLFNKINSFLIRIRYSK